MPINDTRAGATARLPVALRSRGYAMRAETDADLPFLLTLYESTRADELAATGWDRDQRRTFVLHQFTAQRRHYRADPTGCSFAIVTRRGTGSTLLAWVIARAHGGGRRATLFVEQASPALQLYTRLGFHIIGEHGFRYAMACPPP